MLKNKAERLLGLAANAGKVTSGIELCEKIVKSGKAELIVLAKDISDNSKDVFLSSGVDIIYVEDKISLGNCIGKESRSVAVISDKNFAQAIFNAYTNGVK